MYIVCSVAAFTLKTMPFCHSVGRTTVTPADSYITSIHKLSRAGPWTLESKLPVCLQAIRMYEYLYLTWADYFAKLTHYNKTKLLANMTFKRYLYLCIIPVKVYISAVFTTRGCTMLWHLETCLFLLWVTTHWPFQDGGCIAVSGAVECGIYLSVADAERDRWVGLD